MPMRIFFFSSADILGGAERSLQTLVSALSERGHECILITPAAAPLRDWAGMIGIPHEPLVTGTLHQRNPLAALRSLLQNRRFAEALIRTYGPGVFYANTRHSFIMLATLPAHYTKLAHHRDIVSRRINRWLYPRMDRNIFISEFNYTRSDAPDNGQIIYNAAAFDCDLPPVLPPAGGAPLRLAMFARITPYKGHRLALEACQRLLAEGISCHLDIWGEPAPEPRDQRLTQALQEQVGKNALPVSLRGFHGRPEEIMRDYHCILNPSRDEPFGRIPVEAFSLGVPVISHRSGGSLEIYAGLEAYAAYLFDDYTGADLATAIKALVARAQNPQAEEIRLEQIRADIRRRFSITRLADEVEALIETVAPPRCQLAVS